MPLSPRTLRPANTFTPRSISGLALWLDAADSSSLYTTDAGPVTAVNEPTEISGCVLWLDGADNATITASGGLVSQWTDKSASGAVLTASGSARPTLSSTGFNSRQALVFNGTSTNMASVSPYTATNGLSGMTRIAVCQNATSNAVVARVFSGGSDMFVNMNGSWRSPVDSTGSTNFVSSATFSNANNLPAGVYADVFSSGIITQYGFGSTATATINGTIPSTTGTGTPTLHVGSNIGANFFWNGPIAEVIYFNRALTRAELARVEAYLAAKWGISGVHAPATATSDPVGYWRDKSGNGRHATQATAANRPTLGVLGSRNAASFAGSNSVTVPAYPAKATSTYIYVSRHDDTADTIFQTGFTNQFHSHLIEMTSKFRRNEAGASGVVLGSNIGVGSASLWCVDFSNAAASVRYNGATIGSTSTASNTPIADSSLTTTLGRLTPTEAYAPLNGRIAEFMVYGGRNLSASEKTRLERYLAARWGITLAPQVSNADAQDWINRVYANGSTVSASTAAHVNTFCESIASVSGLREKFYRLNLFCGGAGSSDTTRLNACLVPLYRGPSVSNTFGGVTDANASSLFVTGDYNETGASGGLQGSTASGKRLRTGLAQNTMPSGDLHLAAYEIAKSNATSDTSVGARSNAVASYSELLMGTSVTEYGFSNFQTTFSRAFDTAYTQPGAMMIGVASGATQTMYKNGSVTGFATAAQVPSFSSQFCVFSTENESASGADFTNARLGGYSIGLSMTPPQVAAYYTAMQAFQTALQRNV